MFKEGISVYTRQGTWDNNAGIRCWINQILRMRMRKRSWIWYLYLKALMDSIRFVGSRLSAFSICWQSRVSRRIFIQSSIESIAVTDPCRKRFCIDQKKDWLRWREFLLVNFPVGIDRLKQESMDWFQLEYHNIFHQYRRMNVLCAIVVEEIVSFNSYRKSDKEEEEEILHELQIDVDNVLISIDSIFLP